GATWTLVAGPNSSNPIFGLVVTKLLVDPISPLRIYVATGTASVINGNVSQIATNIPATAVPGVYRYDGTGTAGVPTWVNLTAAPSLNRATVFGQAPYDAPPTGVGPPMDAGPDDDYRIKFPQSNATWSDIALVRSGPGFGANPGNTVNGSTWVLYAALGESQQAYFGGAGAQGVFNAVYRTDDPANSFPAGQGPSWWIGEGTSFPVAATNSNEAPTANAIPAPTTPDVRDDGPGQPAFQTGEIVFNPSDPHQPGRNEWIKITAVVTRYYNVDPNNVPANINLLTEGLNMNASIQVFSSELGNSLDFWPYPGGSNPPFGRTNEFLDMQASGWDGGIGNGWNILNPTFPQGTDPFGRDTGVNGVQKTWATGRYSNALLGPSATEGLLDLTPGVNAQVYMAGQFGLYSSTIGHPAGATPSFANISTGQANLPANFYHALYIDKQTKNLLIGTDGGVWYDATGGNIGTNVFTNLNSNLQIAQLNAAAPDPTDFNALLAASYNNGVQQYLGVPAWTGQPMPLPATGNDQTRNSGDVQYNPINDMVAYASAGGNFYRTVDGGANWSLIMKASGVNAFPVYNDPINPQRLLVGGNALLESTTAG